MSTCRMDNHRNASCRKGFRLNWSPLFYRQRGTKGLGVLPGTFGDLSCKLPVSARHAKGEAKPYSFRLPEQFPDIVLAGKRPQFAPKISRPGPRLNLYCLAYKLYCWIRCQVVRRSNSAGLIRLRAYKLPGDICTHG